MSSAVFPRAALAQKPWLMGVLNLTPDSFSDGGLLNSDAAIVQAAASHVEHGARILDIGGESSRPGAMPVSATEEQRRVAPAISLIRREFPDTLLSVDTYKPEVAQAALDVGADIVNDITALKDPKMAAVAARGGAAVILMHMRGSPQTMQGGSIHYDDVTSEVASVLATARDQALDAGIASDQIALDPGIGFGKTTSHNLQLTNNLAKLGDLGHAIVYGPSRKRFLGDITDHPVTGRDPATAASCVAAILAGASILRVHNVAAVKDAVAVATALRDSALGQCNRSLRPAL